MWILECVEVDGSKKLTVQLVTFSNKTFKGFSSENKIKKKAVRDRERDEAFKLKQMVK